MFFFGGGGGGREGDNHSDHVQLFNCKNDESTCVGNLFRGQSNGDVCAEVRTTMVTARFLWFHQWL